MNMPVVFSKRSAPIPASKGINILPKALIVFSLAFALCPAMLRAQTSVEELSPDVRAVLDKKIESLKSELAPDPVIVETVRTYNAANKDLTAEEILVMDKAWRNVPGFNDLIKEILLNASSEHLIAFQEKYDGFAEIFVTDARGLNVAMTNKTSDYYQADEDWWVRAFAGDRGYFYYGEIEYDESAMSEAIPIYAPIIDPRTQKVIGIMKAVVDLVTIRMEL